MLQQSNLVVEDLANEAMTSTTASHNAVKSSASTALTSHTASSIRLTMHSPLLAVAYQNALLDAFGFRSVVDLQT